jgi:hypothetical protein
VLDKCAVCGGDGTSCAASREPLDLPPGASCIANTAAAAAAADAADAADAMPVSPVSPVVPAVDTNITGMTTGANTTGIYFKTYYKLTARVALAGFTSAAEFTIDHSKAFVRAVAAHLSVAPQLVRVVSVAWSARRGLGGAQEVKTQSVTKTHSSTKNMRSRGLETKGKAVSGGDTRWLAVSGGVEVEYEVQGLTAEETLTAQELLNQAAGVTNSSSSSSSSSSSGSGSGNVGNSVADGFAAAILQEFTSAGVVAPDSFSITPAPVDEGAVSTGAAPAVAAALGPTDFEKQLMSASKAPTNAPTTGGDEKLGISKASNDSTGKKYLITDDAKELAACAVAGTASLLIPPPPLHTASLLHTSSLLPPHTSYLFPHTPPLWQYGFC